MTSTLVDPPPLGSFQPWLPLATDDPHTPLAARSVCYINIDDGCDFHTKQKERAYLAAWKSPAPEHCQPRWYKPPVAPPIHADRLGLEVNCEAFR